MHFFLGAASQVMISLAIEDDSNSLGSFPDFHSFGTDLSLKYTFIKFVSLTISFLESFFSTSPVMNW